MIHQVSFELIAQMSVKGLTLQSLPISIVAKASLILTEMHLSDESINLNYRIVSELVQTILN